MKNSTHRHSVFSSVDRGFTDAVSRDENRAAHGNICVIDTCKCGATRRINVNGTHIERGAWIVAVSQ
jgi:hypothetical protein